MMNMYVAKYEPTPLIIAKQVTGPHASASAADGSGLLVSRWFWLGALASVGCWTLLWLALV